MFFEMGARVMRVEIGCNLDNFALRIEFDDVAKLVTEILLCRCNHLISILRTNPGLT